MRPANLHSLIKDKRGVAYVEYVTLLSLVTIVGAVAIAGLGMPLLRLFRYMQMLIALPIP